MGKRSITKGKNWEREVANLLSDALGMNCERQLSEPRGGNLGDIDTRAPISVQCKVGKQPRLWDAVREAQESAEPGDFAIGIVRKNGTLGTKGSAPEPTEDVAILPLSDLLELLSQLRASGAW